MLRDLFSFDAICLVIVKIPLFAIAKFAVFIILYIVRTILFSSFPIVAYLRAPTLAIWIFQASLF